MPEPMSGEPLSEILPPSLVSLAGSLVKPHGDWVIDDAAENHMAVGNHWKKLMTDAERHIKGLHGIRNIVLLPVWVDQRERPFILDLKNVIEVPPGVIPHGYNIISTMALKRDGLTMGKFPASDEHPEHRVWFDGNDNEQLVAFWSHDKFFVDLINVADQKNTGVWRQEEINLPAALVDEERRVRNQNVENMAYAHWAAQQQPQP